MDTTDDTVPETPSKPSTSAKEAFDSAPTKPAPIKPALDMIPPELKALPQWVGWVYFSRDGKWQKMPINPADGKPAEANIPDTWGTFEAAVARWQSDDLAGIGFEFSNQDDYCGVDFDDVRDPETGDLTDNVQDWIARFSTYTEISPSGTGVKLIGKGKLPGKGKNYGKVEIYDRGRFFALTGQRLPGPASPQPWQEALDALLDHCERSKAAAKAAAKPKRSTASQPTTAAGSGRQNLLDRARAYTRKEPPAISGQGGHNRTYHVMMNLVEGFGLEDGEALEVFRDWNTTCQPPWSDSEIQHKLESARANLDPGRDSRCFSIRRGRWLSSGARRGNSDFHSQIGDHRVVLRESSAVCLSEDAAELCAWCEWLDATGLPEPVPEEPAPAAAPNAGLVAWALETDQRYQDENRVTDPVCGMRINRADAPVHAEYDGKMYYFCVAECRDRFAANPARYVAGRGAARSLSVCRSCVSELDTSLLSAR